MTPALKTVMSPSRFPFLNQYMTSNPSRVKPLIGWLDFVTLSQSRTKKAMKVVNVDLRLDVEVLRQDMIIEAS